jgi:membrane fusion protein, multidrug efflux system
MRIRSMLYLSALAALALTATMFKLSTPSEAASDKPVAAETQKTASIPLARSTRATVPEFLTVTGNIVADERSEVVPDAAGKVLAVLVERGQRVEKGQPLVRLDTRAASLSTAEARAMVASAQAQRATADEECKRSATLYAQGAITRSAYDQDQLACRTAGSNLEASEARQRLSAKSVSDGVIRAPFSGVVTETYVSPGEWAGTGNRLVTIVDDDPLIAELAVPESSATKITLGQIVELESITRPGQVIHAAISRVGAEVDPKSRALTVEVALPKGTGIPSGTFVEGRIGTSTRELPQVPRTAIAKRGSSWRLWVAVDGILVERVVQLGPDSSPSHVTIARGLTAGEEVAATAGDGVTDGMRVQASMSR